MQSSDIAELEANFKKQPCAQTLTALATRLVWEDDPPSSTFQRGIQLLQRAAKQYDDTEALRQLAIQYEDVGSSEQKKLVVPLHQAILRRDPSARNHFSLGFSLFYGAYGEAEKRRGYGLMQRAIMLDSEDADLLCEMAKAMLSYPPAKHSRRSAIAMFEKAIQLSNSPGMMAQLAHIFHEGTVVMQPCAKCYLKWQSRAAQAFHHNIHGGG